MMLEADVAPLVGGKKNGKAHGKIWNLIVTSRGFPWNDGIPIAGRMITAYYSYCEVREL